VDRSIAELMRDGMGVCRGYRDEQDYSDYEKDILLNGWIGEIGLPNEGWEAR